MKNSLFAKTFAALILSSFLVLSAGTANAKRLTAAVADWTGGEISCQVAVSILEDELGYEIDRIVFASGTGLWEAIAAGDIDFACESWPSYAEADDVMLSGDLIHGGEVKMTYSGDGSVKLLGTVGEPINPEAWDWYYRVVGKSRCEVIDTWWQTETGSIMISPLPGVTSTKPGSACGPLPGIESVIIDNDGNEVGKGEGAFLAIKSPWPSMLRTVYGDDERYIDTYGSQHKGLYFAGDGAKYDEEGYIWLLGRVDDVMNISGHRISTAEVESALVSHNAVAEAAVIGRSDGITGEAIAAFVSLIGTEEGNEDLIAELRQHVSDKIGPIAKPKSIVITADLPKTRSGKIMRRLLKDISEERKLGDVTTLANADIVSELQTRASDSDDE